MNVPRLRFSEFNGDWNTDKILNVCDAKKGNGLSKNDITDDGYDCILYGELYTKYNEVIRKVESHTKLNSSNFVRSKVNDVIIPASGETPIDIAKASCVMLDNVILGGDLNVLTPNNIDGRFLSYQISYKRKMELANLAQGNSVVHLYYDKFKNVKIKYPSIKEQNKIANTIELIDKKIKLQSKKIEDLKLYKISTKEKLFNNNYERVKLSKILNKWNLKNKNNEYNYVESVSNKYGFIAQNEQFEDRNIASNDRSNYYIIKKNVFAYNPSRLNVGSLALKENEKISLVSPLYECFTTNQNNNYLYEWFDSKEFKKGTISKFEGGVRNTLNFTNLCEIEISLPPLEKQNEIAKILFIINKKIILETNKLDKLNELKKGLMQSMFV